MELGKYSDALGELGYLYKGDYYKLVGLAAYYEIYGGDKEHVQDVLDGIGIDRGYSVYADGVYLNDSFEEDTLEVFTCYFPESGAFVLDHVIAQVKKTAEFIKNIKKGIYASGHLVSEEIISEAFGYEDIPPVLIKVITPADVSAKQKYEFAKKIESIVGLSGSGVHIDATIAFGEDIVAMIESNTEPFEYVKKDKLIMDDPDNTMHYGADSFVCNISAQSLKALWAKEGHKGLLAMNLRYYIKSATIDEKIEESVLMNPNDFWYLNNGIIIVCDDYKLVGNELQMTNFSIVNGGQTTRMIGTIPFDHDFYICCKVIKNSFPDTSSKNRFVSAVAEASNTQKPIKAKDLIANRIEQRDLKSMMIAHKVFIEIKRGEKPDKAKYTEPWQKTKNNELAQDLYSFIYMEPGPSRNAVSKILQNNEKYKVIFAKHSYEFEFLKSLLFLEKSYRAFARRFIKGDADGIQKSLVKNGMYYFLATVGYLLKLKYCTAFLDAVRKYRSDASLFNTYASEQAFNHAFVKDGQSFKEFADSSYAMFEHVLQGFILPVFNVEKGIKETLSPANWTKNNTGFYNIRNYVNSQMLDMHIDVLSAISSYFAELLEGQDDVNSKLYVANCEANRKVKSVQGYVMTEEDGVLRNALMVYRLETATAKHIKENTVFTDKQLDRLIVEKPSTKEELRTILSANTCYYCGTQILEIIAKYL